MIIPFVDLKAQYQTLKEDVHEAMKDVLESCAFAGGPFVERFENAFAEYCRCRFAVGLGSGTDALWLALTALDIGPGDEVVTVPNTFIATAEAVSYCGAKPVFVDVDESTFTMDAAKLSSAITDRTKAVIPVHLYGQTADMDPIMEIAKARGLYVIEDASQAHGARYKDRLAGSIGDVGCFSFYPGKNLGAYGEAGAVTTNDERLAQKIRILRDHGQTEKYKHAYVGWNARMDGLQGAVLDVKLKHLPRWNEARRANAKIYDALLNESDGIVPPKEAPYALHVYHVYAVRIANRRAVKAHLENRGIRCAIHYPIPVHLTEAYRSLGLGEGSFPVSERCANEVLSLPMFPELSKEQISRVAEELKNALLLS